MSQEQAKQLLQKGIAAARANRPDVARPALQQAIRLDPYNETAWLWLSSVAEDDEERIACLRQLLAINPKNEFALKGMRALGVEPVHTTAPTPTTSIPVLDDAHYARVQKPLDDILRRYSPEPPDQGSIEWVRKTRNRYGERGATRLRQVASAAAVLLVLLMVGGAAALVVQSGVLSDNDAAVAALATRAGTQAPAATFTPTPGGPTPTPFPEPLVVPASATPLVVAWQDPFGLATPTAIYPRPDTNVEFRVEEAARYYSVGAYDQAIAILSDERERSTHCYPSVVYYEALSQAKSGNTREAASLLEWAETYQPPRGYKSCQESGLLMSARAEIAYLDDPRAPDALTYSQLALAADPKLVQASVTLARAQQAQGQVEAARATVTEALLRSPDDACLLVVAAELALHEGQPRVALDYVGRALASDPALLPALRLQAQGYLDQAAQTIDSVQRVTYYGLAVRSAQTILLYWPGDASGFVFLAKARLGEGNQDLAENALTRVIAVADALPSDERASVDEAYLLRGDLYQQQGRLTEAAADLEAAYRASGDESLALRLYHVSLGAGEILEADRWLTLLLGADPYNVQYQLLEAQLYVEACAEANSPLQCQYETALDTLSDSFIARLATDNERAAAYSYRAQARYQTAAGSGVVSSEDRRERLSQALEDVTNALAVRQKPDDLYLHGLLAEALGQDRRAYEDYQWVSYWNGAYQYTLADNTLDERYAELAAQVAPTAVPRPTATPTPVEAERPTAVPTATPARARPTATPQPARPSATPRMTATPGPTSTPSPTETPVPTPTVTPVPYDASEQIP